MGLKIYFAGSIRGGREDKDLYFKLIEYLGKFGQVLTEHVGSLDLTEQGEDGPNDEWIYKRDMSWIEESDVIIAEVSTPSLGVGYEIGVAEKLNKKILCLYRIQTNKRLSAMIGGNPNIQVAHYTTFDNAINILDNFFKSFTL